MGILPWDLRAVFNTALPVRNPRITVRCEYPETGMAPTEISFGLSPRYGIHSAREAHVAVFLFRSETVRKVVAT